jgi:hypothetical protein
MRGGGRAEKAEREADTGWTAIERATPKSTPQPLYRPGDQPPPAAASRPR